MTLLYKILKPSRLTPPITYHSL